MFGKLQLSCWPKFSLLLRWSLQTNSKKTFWGQFKKLLNQSGVYVKYHHSMFSNISPTFFLRKFFYIFHSSLEPIDPESDVFQWILRETIFAFCHYVAFPLKEHRNVKQWTLDMAPIIEPCKLLVLFSKALLCFMCWFQMLKMSMWTFTLFCTLGPPAQTPR